MAARERTPTPESSILGTGWTFPPTFSRSSASVDMARDEEDIRQALWNLLTTVPGERVMLPTYGCGIWLLVFRAIDTGLKTQIEESVRQAILYFEPRIDVERVEVQADATLEGKVTVSIDYLVRRTNARNNLVFPFYLAEGTIPGQLE